MRAREERGQRREVGEGHELDDLNLKYVKYSVLPNLRRHNNNLIMRSASGESKEKDA